MNYTVKNNWKYTAKKGYFFRKDDVISDTLYMGVNDSIDNWEVITAEQKATIEAGIKARRDEELKAIESGFTEVTE